jgi:hypothetical protein
MTGGSPGIAADDSAPVCAAFARTLRVLAQGSGQRGSVGGGGWRVTWFRAPEVLTPLRRGSIIFGPVGQKACWPTTFAGAAAITVSHRPFSCYAASANAWTVL